MSERWRDIPGYEGVFQVSDIGRVKRIAATRGTSVGKILKPCAHKVTGYFGLTLRLNGVQKTLNVHQLVMAAFCGQPPSGHEINHKNGDKSDNRLINLEYVTHRANVRHSFTHLGRKIQYGEDTSHPKLTANDVREIRRLLNDGSRVGEVARRYNVSHVTISRIKSGHLWKHIVGDQTE